MDEWKVELAEKFTEAQREETLERIRREEASAPSPVWVDGVPYCAECDDEMERKRAETGRGRCLSCQTDREARSKHYAR